MKIHLRIILFLITVCLSCSEKKSQREQIVFVPKDTTTSFQLGSYWVTPKKSFEFNSLVKPLGDTLNLVTCFDYVYFPFGKLTDQSSLQTSLLKDFKITDFKLDTFTNSNLSPPIFQWSQSLDLQLGDNKLNLFLDNDPEASTHGYIKGGQIVDNKIAFSHNIKIGMNIKDFYKNIFDHYPIELLNKYKIIKFISCVDDVTHIYTFENEKLELVEFNSQ